MLRGLLDRGGLIGIASLALYVALACPSFVDGDSTEMATLGAVGGAAHPSGYPAFVLWLRAMSWLPGSSAAHTAALATALLGAATAWIVYLACRAWGARALAAAIVAGLYATSPLALRYATEAEVFTGNQLVCAAILWLAAARGPLRGTARIVALGLIAGLGMANHLTCVLVAPLGLLGVVRGLRESRLPLAGGVLLAVGALAVGLTPYLYLFVAPDNAASWSAVRSWSALVAHVLREDYGGPGAFSPHAGAVDVGANLGAFVRTLGRAWWWLPLAVGVGWLGVRCARSTAATMDREPRAGWWLLAASFVVAGPLLAARFDIEPVGLGLYVCRRFHMLPLLLLAPAIAGGLDAVLARIPQRLVSLAWVVAVAAVLASALRALPEVAAVHSPAVEVGVRNMLAAAPPAAVLIVTDEELGFGVAYLQLTEGQRADVTVVIWPLTPLPWYRARLARAGVHVTAGAGPASTRLATDLLAAGRPVLVDAYAANILATLPTYPDGILFRVLADRAQLPSVDALAALNAARLAAWQLDYAPPGPDDELATAMHERYARTWMIIAQAIANTDGAAAAQSAVETARRLGPQP